MDFGDKLQHINSMTKYPSMPTYHCLDERGVLQEDKLFIFDDDVFLTEKIDGTNGRIIFCEDGDYYIGSRQTLLYAKGDKIINTSGSIVETLRPIADMICKTIDVKMDCIAVWFFEVYGGNIGKNAKQYTSKNEVGCRVFDICTIEFKPILTWTFGQISLWRDSGGQPFTCCMVSQANDFGVEPVPYIKLERKEDLPKTVSETLDFLKTNIYATEAALDYLAGCKPEGLVLRARDRKTIVKMRYQHYERAIKLLGK